MTFDELLDVYRKHVWLDDDPDILRMLYGVYLANFCDGSPVWVILVGDSGGGKSEILMSMSTAHGSLPISSLTAASLIPTGDDDDSLMTRLKDKVLIVKDLAAIADVDDRGALFATLRDAYDGQMSRSTNKGTTTFRGKFGFIAAGTKSIEASPKMNAMLGERFLHIRIRPGIKGMLSTGRSSLAKRDKARKGLQTAAAEFLNERILNPPELKIPKYTLDLAEEAAGVLCPCRSAVVRDSYSKEISFPVEVGEIPTRVYGQLALIASAMRGLGAERDELNRTIRRIMVDSIPYARLRVLQSIVALDDNSASAIAKTLKLSRAHTGRVLEDLEFLGVIEKSSGKYSIASELLEEAIRENQ